MVWAIRLRLIFVTLLFASPCWAQSEIDFNRQIKPILSDNCFACHGPDASQRPSELRMDDEASMLSDLGGYHAIVPGSPDQSEIVSRILSDDEDLVMPPSDHRKSLTESQKHLLVEWVKQGAKWEKHWAFAAPKKSGAVQSGTTSANFIDTLVGLKRGSIAASQPADRTTLIRRLCFDLTGLPPSETEVENFINNDESYEQLVDRLLASEHYGERMAVYWLDLVRYADSVGYHGDQPISVTPYRDYVVAAFNKNMPFDQFTREQLAGDLLDRPTQDQLVASGYNRLGMMSAEGGVQPKEYLAKYASDRVRTTASVWLGVTLGCAECHDHKFDPFTTKEFYEFASFFADIKERGLYSGPDNADRWGPYVSIPDPELAKELAPIDQRLAELKAKLTDTPEIVSERSNWEQEIKAKTFEWKTCKPSNFLSQHPIDLRIVDDGAIVIGGKQHNKNTYVVTVPIPEKDVKGIRLEVLPFNKLPKNGPGRAGNGNFVVSELLCLNGEHSDVAELSKPQKDWSDHTKAYSMVLEKATATIEQEYGGQAHPDKKWSAASTIDGDKNGAQWGWAILPESGTPNELVIQIAEHQEFTQPEITLVIQQNHGNGNHTLGHFRFSYTTEPKPVANPLGSLPSLVKAALAIPLEDRTPEQKQTLASHYIKVAPRFQQTNLAIKNLEAQRKKLVDAMTRTSLITVSVTPREMRVLARGNWMDTSGEIVQPNVPASLGGGNWEGKGTRLQLANWIIDRNNPLTARVFVNRLWRMYFGSGLSNVLDDFGSQGEPPSHPELLDQLAIEFMESGWDIKHMVKLMVMSSTYRQSSSIRNDLLETDPENRLLARQARFRLEAEFVRDNALSVSGLLNDQIGGRNGKPYQPAGLYRHLNFPKRQYKASKDSGQYRRGLYTHWQRQYLHPAMKTLDAPAREECTAARPRSSTPLAALLLLNDPSYVEAARALAGLTLSQELQSDEARLNWIFHRCLSRAIGQHEQEILTELLNDNRTHYREKPGEAKALISIGLSKSPNEIEDTELAAWTAVCRAVLNLHEFVLRK